MLQPKLIAVCVPVMSTGQAPISQAVRCKMDGEFGQILDSSRNVVKRRLGIQAPSSVRDSVLGEGSSVLPGSASQKARQSELSPFPPARDELVRREHEPEYNQLQLGKFDAPRDLEICGAKDCSDIVPLSSK